MLLFTPEAKHPTTVTQDHCHDVSYLWFSKTIFTGTKILEMDPMQEMRTDSVGDLIEYLIIQMKTGSNEDRCRMAEMLRSVIEGLEGAEIKERDAVVLQALSLAIVQAASDELDRPEQVKRLLSLASLTIGAAVRPLEAVTGMNFSEKTAEFLAPIGNFH